MYAQSQFCPVMLILNILWFSGTYFTAAATFCPVVAEKHIRCLCLLLDIGRLECDQPTLIDPSELAHVEEFQEVSLSCNRMHQRAPV